ncbi:MAG TPA: NADP-dependent oxidoreductase [Mycobacteriales bacterium]|nr:NADP-dependent oxidoreductase [Mycobacteriales bacterium]
MKAVQFAAYGGPEVLEVVEVDEPQAGPGQLRISVRATGVNPFDAKLRSGALAQRMPVALPRTVGTDVAGIVDQVGAGAAGEVGDAVVGFADDGAAAELALVTAWIPLPAALSFPQAAALPVAVDAATRVLDLLALPAGSTLLVNGAAGGVGVFAVQLAVARGLTVIGTASPPNHAFVRSLGATAVAYGPHLRRDVQALTGTVHGAMDAAGAGALPDLVALTGSADRVVTIADPAAAALGVRFSGGAGPRGTAGLTAAAALAAQGRLIVPIAATYPLDGLPDAHREIETGHVRGKLVVEL